jgi:DNA-binding protein HU-beta
MVLNKAELVESVANATGESKRVVAGVLDEIVTTVQKQVKKGEKVTLPGFGTWERRARSARTARNPQTGDPIKIKATKVPAFKPGAGFKSLVSGNKK